MNLSDIGERGAIEEITGLLDSNHPDIIAGPGEDDCAVLKLDGDLEGKILFASDMLTRSRHLPQEMPYSDIGWSAVAVNLSDIASMGGTPRFLTTSLATPDITQQELRDISIGMNRCAREHNAFMVGGDLCKHSELVINCSVVGLAPKNILMRKNAKPNEYLCVTGELGGAGLAAKSITKNLEIPRHTKKKAFEKLFRPQPKIKIGQEISRQGGGAAIDISDGLLISAQQLLNASEVGIQIHTDRIPVDRDIKNAAGKNSITLKQLLEVGGDYEILFTIDDKDKIPSSSTVIGKTLQRKVVMFGDEVLDPGGYDHFK
ncbi:MAG: thiamine-phosphate kinase [Methanonatronarchaeia archaeon]|nr:MAG: thiamine-phosphate kinase [Methanonatronarchaeia archaeon]